MAGNARFHDKLHRKNHHTNPTVGYADSASDPIASPSEPFQGDFVVNGKLSASTGLQVLSANIKGDVYCNNIHVSSVTYTNWISGNSTETIISDGALTGNGNNTLTLDYQKGIYGKSPFFSISNTLCSLGTITSPIANFNTLTVKASSNLNGPLSVFGNTGLNGNLTVTGSSTINSRLSVGNDVSIRGNLLVTGNLSALGDTSVIDTNIVSTSALSVINYGTSQALLVNQIGNYPTAIFQKDGSNVLIVSGGLVNVYGSLSSTSNINSNNINLIQNTSSNWNSVYSSVNSTSSNWNSVYNSVNSTSSNWNNSYNFLTSGGQISGSVITAGNQTLSGNLGIGISALSSRLHVYDNSNNPAVRITQIGSTGDALYVDGNITVTNGRYINLDTNRVTSIRRNTGNNGMEFFTQSASRMFISDVGNIGINTLTPTNTLHVSGGLDVTNTLHLSGELTVVGDISATGTIYTHSSSYSLSSNGYTKLQNGLIMQWGKFACSNSGETTIVFPIPFTNSIYNIVTNPINELGSTANYSMVGSFELSSFNTSVYDISGNRTSQSVFWNAIGI